MAALALLLLLGTLAVPVARAGPSAGAVTFTETGLPTGLQWSVTLNGVQHYSRGTSLSFVESVGTYTYRLHHPAGYLASPANGSVTISASPTTVAILFEPFGQSSTLVSNFNGQNIPGGDYIWFNSVVKVSSTIPSAGLTIHVVGQSISFVVNGSTTVLSVPDAKITYQPGLSVGTTHFNRSENRWDTLVPMNFSDNIFGAGLAFPVPAGGLPKSISNVNWTATFSSSVSGSSLKWQWGAAVYTNFSLAYNLLDVKPLHSTSLDNYHNGNQAGTPEAYVSFVTSGARGGGGSNFTGSYSGTASVALPKN